MEASKVSPDALCIFILIFFLFGLAISADQGEDHPQKVPWYVIRDVTIDWEEE